MTTISSSPNIARGSVRDYLTGAGIPTDSVTAKGFGKTQPVASNDTAAAGSRIGAWNWSSPAN